MIVAPPTDEEVNAAITGNMGHLVTVVSYPPIFVPLIPITSFYTTYF